MGLKSSVRSVLRSTRQYIWSALYRPAPPYRPDLSDEAFIGGLLPESECLRAAVASAAAGDNSAARRHVVEHFLNRRAPRFFSHLSTVPEHVEKLKADYPHWVEATRNRVESDLHDGLRVVATRGKPLSSSFDWAMEPPGPGADDLYPAQPHRFGFMPRLALAAHYGVPTVPIVAKLLDRWIAVAIAGNPMCYLSPLVVLYRLLALHWTFTFVASSKFADGGAAVDLAFSILKVIWADSEYLKGQIGHSYPNNHLLADGFAGWYLGSQFPEFLGAAEARVQGETLFLHELRRQFLDDGTNFEHSIHYHELGCEMALGYTILQRRNGAALPADNDAVVRRMLAFQAAVSGPEAIPFPMGDSTEDPLFPLDAEHGWASGALRECYRALFDPGLPPTAKKNLTVERAFWLLDGTLAEPRGGETADLPADFAVGGIHVLSDLSRSSRLIFRSGPVEGQPISAGHSHSDILSIFLSVEGVPLIVNSGTYTYRAKSRAWRRRETDWRRYFAGQESHNGVCFEQDPYGAMTESFRDRDIPCRVAPVRLATEPGLRWMEFRVAQGLSAVDHRRGLIHVEGEYWIVVDIPVAGSSADDASIRLQFAPGSSVASREAGTFDATMGAARCRVALSPQISAPTVFTGSLNPLAGWVSPSYGELVPAPQLQARLAPGDHACAFVLQVPQAGKGGVKIADASGSEDFLALCISDGSTVDFLLLRKRLSDAAMSAWGVEYAGELAWLRTVDGAVTDSRCIGDGRLILRGAVVATRPSSN